jgi:hypothetical protein
VNIKGARNEYESFQVVIRGTPTALRNVRVSVSDLSNEMNSISRKNVTLYREHFVYVSKSSPDLHGSNRPLGQGWYPDGLIPFLDPSTGLPIKGTKLSAEPFSVARNKNEVIWADVYVPLGTPAGQYKGTVTVASDQGSTTLPLQVTVWDFDLPIKPALKSLFPLSLSDAEILLRNRVMPMMIHASSAKQLMAEGLSITALSFSSGATIANCTMSAPPPTSEILQEKAFFPIALSTYVWSADEVTNCTALFPQILAWGQALHRAGVQHLVTMAPVPQLLDDRLGTGRSAVDYWAVLPITYDQHVSTILTAQAKGDEVWSYNALVQDGYSPKWEIDFTPINFRIQPGFMSQSLGLKGILYWRLNNWSADPWNQINWTDEWGDNYPGEGVLVYPGTDVGISGVAPSMRLKQIRDGVEDYDYVELLKAAGEGNLASNIVDNVARDWHIWTQDNSVLNSAREALGMELDRLGSTGQLK